MSISKFFADNVGAATFLSEDGKLTADYFDKFSSKRLSKLEIDKDVRKLYLRGFVFDEENAKQFSDTFTNLQELTLDQCDINDELVSQLVIPSGLKSIRLERVNLSLEEIQKFINPLSSQLESFELVDCLISELPQLQLLDPQKVPLDFSKFSSLKNIFIENSSRIFDSYHLLLSLSLLPLERIKLSLVDLSTQEWTLLLDQWNGTNRVSFFKSLKEFNLKIEKIDDALSRLVQFFLSFPCLEIFSLNSNYPMAISPLPPLPSNIKQFLIPFKVYVEGSEISFFNSNNLSHLTHLIVDDFFKAFPYDLFDLKQLEYLKIWCDGNPDYSLLADRQCANLKYLSIQSEYLIPLLPNFESNFPVLEGLHIVCADSYSLDFHLIKIISKKTLKYLQIDYDSCQIYFLSNEKGIETSIEELKLTEIGKYASDLLEIEQFSCLQKIHIEAYDWAIDLRSILKRLNSLLQLTSLTLFGDFSFSNEQLQFTFEKINFFRFGVFQKSIDFDNLLSCMPNLIELQLEGKNMRELKLQKPVGVRYLTLPIDIFRNNGDFINIIKNTPNLVQLTTKENWSSPIHSIPFAPELAYYLKVLKRHFQNDFQFEINPNCFPIQQLTNDAELLKLVRLKSPELPNYLNRSFPIDTYNSFVEQLFTIVFEKYVSDQPNNYRLMKILFNLLDKMKFNSEKDIVFMQKLLFEGGNDSLIETTNFSVDNFYKYFSDCFIKNVGINLEPIHLIFIEEFYKTNKKYGPLRIFNFLKSFFTSLSITNDSFKIINNEIFDFFAKQLLSSSFRLLFDKIKRDDLNEQEIKFLSFDCDLLAEYLKNIEPEQYEKLSASFKDILIQDCEGSFEKNLFNILKAILIPEAKCSLCMKSFFTEECKFFKSKSGNCHFFHRNCLNEWHKQNANCPNCKRPPYSYYSDSEK